MLKHSQSTPDGFNRSAAEEARLNILIAQLLGTAGGKSLMEYLESITIRVACGPHVTDSELRHIEGQRFIVGLLSQRIALGHQQNRKQTNVNTPKKSK